MSENCSCKTIRVHTKFGTGPIEERVLLCLRCFRLFARDGEEPPFPPYVVEPEIRAAWLRESKQPPG